MPSYQDQTVPVQLRRSYKDLSYFVIKRPKCWIAKSRSRILDSWGFLSQFHDMIQNGKNSFDALYTFPGFDGTYGASSLTYHGLGAWIAQFDSDN